jgi:hypothetical protein
MTASRGRMFTNIFDWIKKFTRILACPDAFCNNPESSSKIDP